MSPERELAELYHQAFAPSENILYNNTVQLVQFAIADNSEYTSPLMGFKCCSPIRSDGPSMGHVVQ